MNHTKEPWSFDDYKRVKADSTNEFLGVQVDGFSLSGSDEAKANSRRIVLCINACAGRTNEQLEGFAGKIFTGSEIELWTSYCDVKAQRDELLAALKRIESWNETSLEFNINNGSNGQRDYYRNIARGVIAKCEAQS